VLGGGGGCRRSRTWWPATGEIISSSHLHADASADDAQLGERQRDVVEVREMGRLGSEARSGPACPTWVQKVMSGRSRQAPRAGGSTRNAALTTSRHHHAPPHQHARSVTYVDGSSEVGA
jgi:hypothetical protein